jgi:SWI/SNF-related matrix-associated actin-dependent regulator 1 of chromatin subfamily A
VQAYAFNPQADNKVKEKLRQVYDVLGSKFPSHKVKEFLEQCDYDVEQTIARLESSGRKPQSFITSHFQSSNNNKTTKQVPPKQNKLAVRPSPREAASTPPKPPRRRLVQGLRNRGTPSPMKSVPDLPEHPSSDDPLVIDLVDNNEDAYEAERSPSPELEADNRVLRCINTSTAHELAAITGIKETLLEPLIEQRPFKTLAQARKVGSGKKPGARKASRISIGDSVVDAIDVFLDAAAAIDKVVARCETQAKKIKSVMDSWDLDVFGHSKKSGRGTPVEDLPPTPTSLGSSRLVRPPIANQPGLMSEDVRMKPFQVFGLNWMSLLHSMRTGCILADEMGLGKTCQVISLMCHLVETYEDAQDQGSRAAESSPPWPNLIVVPPSTYKNWLAEFEKFAPELSVIGYSGSQAERAEIAWEVQEDPQAYHVVLATYSQINNETDIDALRGMGLHAAIFDEGHKMKNPGTKVYKDLRRIPSQWKMLLTGTPVQNNLLEMTALLSFINPEIFEGYMEQIRFIFSHKVSIRDVTNGAFLYSERVKRARTILEPFILQRRKDQVLSDMPKKVCNIVHCKMTDSQRRVYDEYEATFKLEPSQRVGKMTGRQNDLNNTWMQLRKAAIHPLLFRRHFSDATVEKMARVLMASLSQEELRQKDIGLFTQELKNLSDFELHLWCRDYPKLIGKFDYPPEAELDSGKIRKLLEMIDQYQTNGDRVLVFSKFSRVIEMLEEVLAFKDIDYRVIMGHTEVAQRQQRIDEFNEDPSIPVFLLTTGAGGTGINLTSANKVIIFDQSDNPQDDIQAENRAHRLGQKREVEIIRLLSSDSIEELINKACQKKIELANKVTGSLDQSPQEAEQNLEKEVRKMMNEQMTPP